MSSEKWTEPDREAEALAEGFFSQPPAAFADAGAEPWEAAPMPAANRRAMLATLGLLGCSGAATLVFALLSEHVLVAPAELSGAARYTGLSAFQAPAVETVHVATQPLARVAAPREAEPALVQAQLEIAPAAPPVPMQVAVTPAPAEVTSAAQKAAREAPARAATANGDSDAERLTRGAYRALGQGDAREAEHLANLALMQDGTSAGTYIVLAGARDALGNAEGARSAIRACVLHAKDRLAATCKTLAR